MLRFGEFFQSFEVIKSGSRNPKIILDNLAENYALRCKKRKCRQEIVSADIIVTCNSSPSCVLERKRSLEKLDPPSREARLLGPEVKVVLNAARRLRYLCTIPLYSPRLLGPFIALNPRSNVGSRKHSRSLNNVSPTLFTRCSTCINTGSVTPWKPLRRYVTLHKTMFNDRYAANEP
ncbi:PREDICTED: uncharacterized protein LOC105145595 [Acromyrmex echinatior]|uniref:uncharacterized protein LOC105145595 n=1 Tax=Acromyrmex echinatior TaxID=103372 RepID=UPI0005810D68|nr:PREDICTED: uncharacterized protein LOC105145595 [Acromyrmex echinatior]